jgi:hypothetical protein
VCTLEKDVIARQRGCLFEDLGDPRLAEVAKNGKSNVRTLTRMNEGSVLACTSLAEAEGTAGVEFAGGAERTTTAKPEALELGAYGEAGCGRGTPPQGEVEHESSRHYEKAGEAHGEAGRRREMPQGEAGHGIRDGAARG